MELSSSEILNLSYPDFVAFLEQENSPPGAEYTLDYWSREGQVNSSSFVFDLACTTGFSLRRASVKTGCTGIGLDISRKAVVQANAFAKRDGLEGVQFIHGDAISLPFKDSLFTHVFGGSNFSFIQKRELGLLEVARVLRTNGILCVSNYCYVKKPTMEVLNSVESVIGFRPSEGWTEEYWNTFLSSKFALFKSKDLILPKNSDEEIYASIDQQLKKIEGKLNQEQRDTCRGRIFKIRSVLNEHRDFQKISLQIWIKK